MFHFTANLKPYTFSECPPFARFDAYLLSADYANQVNLDMAARVREDGRLLVADNGNVDLLRAFSARFREAAKVVDGERKDWEAETGRYARPGDLPTSLRKRFNAVAADIARASRSRVTEEYTRHAVERQLSMRPDLLVGMEDLTLGTMAALNLEPEYCAHTETFYEQLADAPIAWARRTTDGEFGPVEGTVLAGLHALDFDSAVIVGRRAAEAGLNAVALGMFGALTDRNYVDYRVEDGRILSFPRPVPRPYVRVVELVAGVVEGYRRAGRPKPSIHALGVGTPILLPLLALLGDGAEYFATDSTSPIVDGWSSPTISLYIDDPAPMKYRGSRIAEIWLKDGRAWNCPCHYCEGFRTAHPPKVNEAYRWWKREGKPRIVKRMLERDGPLSALLPFLGYAEDDELRREAGLARVGHNHVTLRRIQDQIRRRRDDNKSFGSWVEAIVQAYERASRPAAWRTAVREAYTLAASVAQR